jgi:two-component system C4-dicarboxylate transport response regulator DctD
METEIVITKGSNYGKALDGVKVVLIERHDDLRSALAEFLSQRGARVIGFPQPSQALEAVEQMQADVVILELTEDENGFQLFRTIRILQPETVANTPVIAMNSPGFGLLRNRALKEGFNEYLDKPFTPKKMLESIQSALHFSG